MKPPEIQNKPVSRATGHKGRKIAYADPPYIGYAKYYPEKQEVDHQRLILELETNYDAWALSCYSNSLHTLLPFCKSDVRIAAWVKPFAVFKVGVNPAYAWEPLLFRPLPRSRKVATIRDWISVNPNIRGRHLKGAKPAKFCYWLFELLGAREDDELFDLFPGTGIVTECWLSYQDKLRQTQSVMRLE